MNNKLHFLLSLWIALFFILPPNAFSRHIVGGHISYECLGRNGSVTSIEYTLEMIRESNGSGAFFDNSIQVGVYHLVNNEWSLFTSQTLGLENVEGLPTQLSPYLYQPNPLAYEKGTYRSSISLQANGGPYMLAYQRCCRLENTFTNVSGLDSLGTALTVMITSAGLTTCNNSVRFEADGNRFLLLNNLSEKDFNIQDSDQDALVVNFTAPIIAGGLAGSPEVPGDASGCKGLIPAPNLCLPPFESMPFLPGYSPTQPFGLSSDILIDPQTYILRGTPIRTGLFQIALQVEEYRNGVLLSTSVMEYIIEVIDPIEIAVIRTHTFYDRNNNLRRDTLEPLLDIPLMIKEPTLQGRKVRNSVYEFATIQPGVHTLYSTGKPQWRINTPDDSLRIFVDSLRAIYEIEVPITPSIEGLAFEVVIEANTPICNNEQKVLVKVFNYSDTLLSGNLCFFPDSLTSFVGISDTVPNQPFKLDYGDIPPLIQQSFLFTLNMPDETHIGELIEFKLVHNAIGPDSSVSDTICWSAMLMCAFDPNDKLAYPDREQATIFPNEALQYMIRFQNTGNFPAKDVVISDTLDQNLDLSSLQVTSSSHFFRLQQNNHILNFRFLNIYLPDSTSSPMESQGYISFRIKPKAGLTAGTQIRNRAAIYFDQNPPIITNTVNRSIVDRIEPLKDRIPVYPNPYRDYLYVDLSRFITTPMEIEFYDIQGKYLGKQLLESEVNSIPIRQFSAGMHFYRILTRDGEEIQTGKIVKQ